MAFIIGWIHNGGGDIDTVNSPAEYADMARARGIFIPSRTTLEENAAKHANRKTRKQKS